MTSSSAQHDIALKSRVPETTKRRRTTGATGGSSSFVAVSWSREIWEAEA